MKKLGFLVALVIGMSSNAFSQIISVDVDNNPSWVTYIGAASFSAPADGVANLSNNITWGTAQCPINSQISILSADTSYDLDPTLHYGFSANNFSSLTQTYTMTFTLPLSQGFTAGELVSVSSSISGSAAPGDSGAPVLGLASGSSFVQQSLIGNTDLGAPLDLIGSGDLARVNSNFNSATSAFFPTFPGSPNTTTTVITASEASAGTIQVVASFTLNGGSSATISGNLAVVPVAVPEPSSIALFVIGAAGTLVMTLRRRSRID
jgi:PEP-CTERM motif